MLAVLVIGIVFGALFLAATATILHKTGDTAFCVSCHSMQQPLAEYQGSVHFQNPQGVRAECADCHIPPQPVDYLLTKAGALKDVWGEMTGKIATPENYQAHKLAMAQSVWQGMKANDSASCRRCHSFNAMDMLSQSAEARIQHPQAIAAGQTCIDCHKGVAHIMPDMRGLAVIGASALAHVASATPKDAATLYTTRTETFSLPQRAEAENDGTLMPTTRLIVIARHGDRVSARLMGWQQDGVAAALYAGQGKRILSALLAETAVRQLKTLSTLTDTDTGQRWHQVELTVELPAAHLIDQPEAIWRYAASLMADNCTGCHGLTALDRFTANQWIGVVKGMSGRTSLTAEQTRILTQYVQKHASDMPVATPQDKP